MSIRSSSFTLLVAVLSGIALSMAGCALCMSSSILRIDTAQAQSTQENPLEKARTAVETLINRLRGQEMPEGIVKTNGVVEGTLVDVATKYPGRLAMLTKNEGDEVTAGEVVATISSPETEAQLRAAQAQVVKAKQALASAEAVIVQKKSDVDFTSTDYDRGKMLIEHGNISQQMLDQRRDSFESAKAAYDAAIAKRDQAAATIKAAQADVERLESVLADMVLVSPRSGRVQYRLARAGEVVAAGQRILTILDLRDVYLTIYLPEAVAGKLTLGDEARVILDPAPEYVVPANVAFVATDAQYVPKSVETAEQWQTLMFRVKLQGDPAIPAKYHTFVKTGVRGLGFVRTDPKIPWPAKLAVKLPQ